LLLFAGLVVHQIQAAKVRLVTDTDLLEQLAGADFLEDEPLPANQAAEWPQWRGARRDGTVAAPNLLTAWPKDGPRRLWRQPSADGYSSLAVTGNRAWTLLRPEGEDECVVCWQADDGKELWRQSYPAYPGSVEYGNWPRSTPTLDGELLYTVGTAGQFQCRAADTGELHWQHDLVKEYSAVVPKWGLAFSPLVAGDRVITTPGGPGGNSVVAFDKKTGAEVWKSLDDPPGYSSPIAITVAGQAQIVVFTGQSLVGLQAENGRLLWQYPWATDFNVNAATPIAFRARGGGEVRQYLFITSGYKKGCALLWVRPTATGAFQAQRVFESTGLCSHFSSPVRYQDHVYGFNETELTCLSLRSGAVRWARRGFKKGNLLLAGHHLIVLGEEGQLAVAEATPTSFHPLSEARPVREHSRCWNMPVLANGLLFLRDVRNVTCLNLRQGEE